MNYITEVVKNYKNNLLCNIIVANQVIEFRFRRINLTKETRIYYDSECARNNLDLLRSSMPVVTLRTDWGCTNALILQE